MKMRSEKQERILEFIRDWLMEHEYPPSIRDIQRGCSISSTSVVDYNLRQLEARGLIRRDREVSRGITVIGGSGPSRRTVDVPVLGTIAAGQPLPLPSEEGIDPRTVEETVTVTRDMVHRRRDVFALRVRGTSMIDALVDDGDLVLLQPTRSVDDGEMAAVRLKRSNEVTLKHVYREGKKVRLQPANATMDPIYADAADIEVQGRVVSVIRSS